MSDVDSLDFILFGGIFVEITKHTEAAILWAFYCATSHRKPEERSTGLLTTREQMRRKHFALSTRLQELLQIKGKNPLWAFELV